jgi:uncharacterized protein (UPF0147 family)
MEVLNVLNHLQKDTMVPKNARAKIKNAHSTLLNEDKSLSLRIDKSIQELDEVAEDPNLPVDTKTQLWNIFSKLECIQQ